jgi:hypothetical protein
MSAWLATKLPARVGGTALHNRNPALNSAKPVPSRIVIASRESRLALWQAEHVRVAWRNYTHRVAVEILGMTTRGDQILDRPLSAIGGKGLFIKELEVAMQEGSADLAVHSMKDLPMEMPEGFVLAAISARENPCDAFVSNRFAGLDELPARCRGRHLQPASRSDPARRISATRDPWPARQPRYAAQKARCR